MQLELLYGFVLTGAVIHAASNIWKKHLLTQAVHEDVMTVYVMLGAAITGYAASFLFFGFPKIEASFWPPFAVTAVLNIFIQYLNVKSLKLEDASIVVPLSSAMPMFLIVMSYVILRESPTFWGRIGIGCIAFGAYILYLGGKPAELPAIAKRIIPERWHGRAAFWAGPWLRLLSSKGARLALLVAYLGAISVNFDKLASIRSNPAFFTASASVFVAGSIFAMSASRGRWSGHEKSRGTVFRLLVLGVVFGIAGCLYNTGYLYGIVPYVGALKRTQILWSVLFAFLILREGYFKQRIAGAAILTAGAILLSF